MAGSCAEENELSNETIIAVTELLFAEHCMREINISCLCSCPMHVHSLSFFYIVLPGSLQEDSKSTFFSKINFFVSFLQYSNTSYLKVISDYSAGHYSIEV